VTGSTLDVAVYGIINAGKSSLINALLGRAARPTGPIGGTTAAVEGLDWRVVRADDPPGDGEPSTYRVRLIDTPGIEEVDDRGRGALATEAAKGADLVLFVVAEDLTATSRRALVRLREAGKPIVVVLNKVDLLDPDGREAVVGAIRTSLDGLIDGGDVIEVASAPIVRRRVVALDGSTRIEATRGEPEVEALAARLGAALAESAADLKALAEISGKLDAHIRGRDRDRATVREHAVKVADETAAALALALAVNPLPLLDFLAGPGGLAFLARRVSEVYGEPLSGEVARSLASELVRGGRVALWGSLGATVAGGAMKFLPGLGHLAGALTQGVAAGYFAHVVGRALVDYLENGRDWGDGGLIAALDRVAASTDRRALTRGLVDQIKGRLKART